jgi:beta-hydroxylase
VRYFKSAVDYPCLSRLNDLYPVIRKDTEKFLADEELDKAFLTLTSTATKSVKSQAQDWKTLPFVLHGEDPDDIRQRYNMKTEFRPFYKYIKEKHFLNCRKDLLEWAHEPANGIVSLWFSYFEPGCKLGLHTNDDPYMYRAHLGLIVPDGEAAFKVCDEVLRWKEGETLVFDSCNPHTAWNLTDKARMLFVVDFFRPEMPRDKAVAMEREQFHRMIKWNPESMGMSGGYRDLPKDVIAKYAVPGIG